MSILADQVARLERENERLKRKLELESKVIVVLKAHGGFIRHASMREQDITPEILVPVPSPMCAYSDHIPDIKVRRFRLEKRERNLSGQLRTAIYREE